MTKLLGRKACLIACAVAAALTFTASADVIFDNSSTDLELRFDPGKLTPTSTTTFEIGDQIILFDDDPNSTITLTNFSFEYWAVGGNETSFAGTAVEARVRFYRMDGEPFNGYITPDSSLYDSGWFGVPQPTDRNTFVFGAADFGPGGLFLPTRELTWSVQFRGLGTGDLLGVDLYSPPTVGQDYPDYWRKVNGLWILEQNNLGFPVDFGARFEATVPEPSSLTLLVFGGLGALLVARRRK